MHGEGPCAGGAGHQAGVPQVPGAAQAYGGKSRFFVKKVGWLDDERCWLASLKKECFLTITPILGLHGGKSLCAHGHGNSLCLLLWHVWII